MLSATSIFSFPLYRNTMNLLSEDKFRYQFGNESKVPKPQGRRKTYLCYQLKHPDGSTLDQGCVKNKKKDHAEIRFIKKISSLDLDQTQSYKITCYITWSPCLSCAEALVAFIKDCPHLSLLIFASRLFCHWLRKCNMALLHLWTSNILLLVMGEPEFADCWEHFVDNQGKHFEPWEKLTQISEKSKRRLLRILGSTEQLCPQNDLVDIIRNLNLDAHDPHSGSS
ncbi:DNA dC-_dU-editing enzyme APOBEC-3H-like isoform X2 [Saccopteryx leptura]|uniref:DNA dC->dU-editing enzyme APOBEC-3H-like isoform X2 n=1 Tax=Saccopteryx leptura TaxID=249018 RepID=UPI00339C72DF